jgi:ribosome biogenesis GTPase
VCRALRSDGTGRHTTVTRELRAGPSGGGVLDTPGLRTVGLPGADAIVDVFPEVEELSAHCRFGDCEHRTEPGCAVLAAVEPGDLSRRRLDSCRKLLKEAAHQASRVDARLRAAETGRIRAQQRATGAR